MIKTISILRHGEAEPMCRDDAQRALTNKGLLHSRAAGSSIERYYQACGAVDAVFYSPFERTRQTAQVVREVLASTNSYASTPLICESVTALLGDNKPQSVCQWLDTLTYNNIVLISHQPLVSNCLDWMIDGKDAQLFGDAGRYPFYPSTLAVLSCEVIAAGCFQLEALLHHP